MSAPYYDDGTCAIYHGDAAEVMGNMVGRAPIAPRSAPPGALVWAGKMALVDIVVTSPPYNMGLVPGGNGRGMYRPGASNKAGRFRDGYGEHDDAMAQDEYDDWQRECLALMNRLTGRAVFYNHRPRVEHGRLRPPLSMDFGPALNPLLRQIIIWDRGTGIDVNLRHFCTRQEWIMLFAGATFTLRDHAASGMGDVWRLGMEHAETGHPAPFPVSLPARCIEATAATSVLDPFMGSGTTLRAAKDAGIKAIGIELNEAYCEIAAKRLAQEVLDFGSPAPIEDEATG